MFNGAARVLQMFKLAKAIAWTSDTRSAWSRFALTSLKRSAAWVLAGEPLTAGRYLREG